MAGRPGANTPDGRGLMHYPQVPDEASLEVPGTLQPCSGGLRQPHGPYQVPVKSPLL